MFYESRDTILIPSLSSLLGIYMTHRSQQLSAAKMVNGVFGFWSQMLWDLRSQKPYSLWSLHFTINRGEKLRDGQNDVFSTFNLML